MNSFNSIHLLVRYSHEVCHMISQNLTQLKKETIFGAYLKKIKTKSPQKSESLGCNVNMLPDDHFCNIIIIYSSNNFDHKLLYDIPALTRFTPNGNTCMHWVT